MRRLLDSGIFEIFYPRGDLEGRIMNMQLKARDGLYLSESGSGMLLGSSCVLTRRPSSGDILRFFWEDELDCRREKTDYTKEPVSVYELYLGSFCKPETGRTYCNYRELAPKSLNT